MKHPVRSDFYIVVTEAGVNVTFKPTNSVYSFFRLAEANDIGRLGPISFAGVQHAGRNTEDYSPDKVQDRRSASRQNSSGQFASKSGAHLRAFLVSQPMTLRALDLSRSQASRGVLHQKSPRPFG